MLKMGFTYNEISIKLNRTNKSIKEKSNKLGYISVIPKKEIICLECGQKFTVPIRNKKEKLRKFCSQSCSTTHNNKNRKKKKKFCLYCGELIDNEKGNKRYCNNKCQQEHQYKRYIEKWKNGEVDGINKDGSTSSYIKRYIHKKYDNKCTKCEWNIRNEFTGNIPLEVEHIDGNSENNKEENLTLLCPNCHALTETYKGANKGNGRHNRMKRYYDRKSY